MITIDTERLTLRNFCPGDWQQLQELAVQYQATEWAQYEPPWPTSDEGVQGMADWFSRSDDYLAVCLRDTGTLIGLIALERRKGLEQRIHNLGYVFHPAHYGRGYATEGCRAAMEYLFTQLGADGVLTGTHPDNAPSVRLLERLGLKGIERGEYAISRDEWLALSQHPGTMP